MYKEIILQDLSNSVAAGDVTEATADKVRAYMESPEGASMVEELDHSNHDVVNAAEIIFCLGA